VRRIAGELLALPFAGLDLEGTVVDNLAGLDPDQLEFVEMRVGYGCVDTRSGEVEPVAVVRDRIRAAVQAVGSDRLWISPDCGLRLLTPDSARAKLAGMVEAVQDVRAEL
jgi:5-methyltetrahydropteroyltriglutamate--homocysteine methyltransferase